MENERIARSKECTEESVRAGAKAAGIAFVASVIPTVIIGRKVPWAKAHLNYTAQAMIVSAASISAYFIAADKTIIAYAKKNAQSRSG